MTEADLDYPLLSEEEFRVALARLNAIFGLGFGWQGTTANKGHVDEFGTEIRRGEHFYKRQYGAAYGAVLKMSRRSMDKLLHMTVHHCPNMEGLGDLMLKEQREQFMAVRDRTASLEWTEKK